MKQVSLSKKQIKSMNKEIFERYGAEDFIDKGANVALVEDEYVVADSEFLFFLHEDKLVPTLRLLLRENFLKKIEVNMGAVPFMVKGADLMRPGIVGIDTDVKEGDFVAIVDENHNKPVAVGESLFSKEEMLGMETGKMILNIHHVGDDVWNFQKG